MALSNDSIAVTEGSGQTVSTHAVGGKEHQVMMLADAAGHLKGTKPTWIVSTGNTIHVAAARTTLADLFNASGSGVVLRVVGLYVIPALAAVAGVGQTYEAIRTSAVGTGGTTITPQTLDTANSALPAQVTARTKATGGATTAATLFFINGSSEETTPYAGLASQLNHLPRDANGDTQAIVLREGEGLKIDQTTNSAIGNVNVVLVVTVE